MMNQQGDYAVKVGVRNGRILRRMRELGISSQAELARIAGVAVQSVNVLVGLRKAPIGVRGEWASAVLSIASALRCDPEDLFSEGQRNLKLETNSTEVYMDEPEVRALMAGDGESAVWAKLEVERLLAMLPNERMRTIIRQRAEGATFGEVGDDLGVSVERVRQLEIQAHRKMRLFAHRQSAEVNRNILFGKVV